MQTFRLEKGSDLTYQEADDNLRYPHTWDIGKLYSEDMVVFDGTEFYYLCILDIPTTNTIALNNTTHWKKLAGVLSLALNDLTDVNTSGALIGSTIVFDGTNWVVSGSLPTLSHSQMLTLISNNEIVEGRWYKMEYTNKENFAGSSSVYSGVTETLFLLGISSNEVSKQVISLDFPQDLIYYDINNTLCFDGTTPREGYITYRKNITNNIEFPYDFRNTKIRRFKQDNPSWSGSTSYTEGDCIVNANRLFGCRKTHTSGVSFVTDETLYWTEILHLTQNVWGEYVVPSSVNNLAGFKLGGFDIQYDTLDYQDFNVLEDIDTTFDVIVKSSIKESNGDILIGQQNKGITILDDCAGITIGKQCKNLKIGSNCESVYIGILSVDNEIGSDCNEIGLGEITIKNKIYPSCNKVMISRTSADNVIYSANNYISLSSGCVKTEIVSCYLIRIGNNCFNVSIYNVTGGLDFGKQCNNIEIKSSSGIVISDNCSRLKLVECSVVELGSNCKYIECVRSNQIIIGQQSENLNIYKSSAIELPDSSVRLDFKNCNYFSFNNTPVVEDCIFIDCDTVTIEYDVQNCKFLSSFSNKTIQATLTNITTTVSSTTTDTLSSNISDLNFCSKSPNGKIWAIITDNAGVVTTQSLT